MIDYNAIVHATEKIGAREIRNLDNTTLIMMNNVVLASIYSTRSCVTIKTNNLSKEATIWIHDYWNEVMANKEAMNN